MLKANSEKDGNDIQGEEKIQQKKFTQEEHYFKVDKRILDIASTKDLPKSELLIYLHHCRSKNPKGKFQGCSIAGKNILSKNLLLEDRIIEKATENLISKHFIEKCPDVKTGKYQSTAIKVLPYPQYNPPLENQSTGSFSKGDTVNKSEIIQPLVKKLLK